MDFFDPMFLIGVSSIAIIIVLLYITIKRMKPAREVMYLRERDRRGQRLNITEETATAIFCKARKGVDKRFFKWGGSYVFNEGGKQVTRFFGKEGTAYTYKFQSTPKSDMSEGQESSNPTENNSEVSTGIEMGKLKDALIYEWGIDFYNEIPEEQRAKIEDAKVFVTVELESGLSPVGYSPVSEEDINEEQDRNAARLFASSLKTSIKSELYKGFLWAAVGALIMFILFNWHIFNAP